MATPTKSKTSSQTLWLAAGGAVALFLVGRHVGSRLRDSDLEELLAQCGPPEEAQQLADTAAHASSLSHQLYEISQRLRA